VPRHQSRAEHACGIVLVAACLVAGDVLVAQSLPAQAPPPPDPALRTFHLPKPVLPAASSSALQPAGPVRTPASHETLRTMVGVGYVEGADWGVEVRSDGSFAGAQVQLNTLVTRGREGWLFDHGRISVFQPDSRWHVEAGDLFSHLGGVQFGARVAVKAGARRPSVAVYGSRRGMPDRPLVVSYRDQLVLAGQTVLDAEVASDRSYLLRNRLSFSRFDVESLYRSRRDPSPIRHVGVSGGVRLGRGISLYAGVNDASGVRESGQWRTVALRVPLWRSIDLTLERAFAAGRDTAQTTTAAMASVAAGDLRFFHRYQHGGYDLLQGGHATSLERQQTTSMTTYTPRPGVNFTLQLATQRADDGRVQHWEELQATVRLSPTTTLRAVTAVPDLRDPDRFQAYLSQELPAGFAVQADYGRLSAYQSIARELDRSRFKVMLFKRVGIATPARGATVAGRVLDTNERGVAGALVKLGPYATYADSDGSWRLRHVPAGAYDLALDPRHLPADFAWDGQHRRLEVRSSGTIRTDLRVTPLNAIHGRVFLDRNGNGRADDGEAVAGAVVRTGEQLTVTGADGTYGFYNLWPGLHPVQIERLPAPFVSAGHARDVTLRDGAPVTGVDFVVDRREKPVIWQGSGR
jgi:hypothetical protein